MFRIVEILTHVVAVPPLPPSPSPHSRRVDVREDGLHRLSTSQRLLHERGTAGGGCVR